MGEEIEKQNVPMNQLTRKGALKHLTIELLQHSAGIANIFHGCHLVGSINIPKTPKQMSISGKEAIRVVSIQFRLFVI